MRVYCLVKFSITVNVPLIRSVLISDEEAEWTEGQRNHLQTIKPEENVRGSRRKSRRLIKRRRKRAISFVQRGPLIHRLPIEIYVKAVLWL